jgi:hypothetical protein
MALLYSLDCTKFPPLAIRATSSPPHPNKISKEILLRLTTQNQTQNQMSLVLGLLSQHAYLASKYFFMYEMSEFGDATLTTNEFTKLLKYYCARPSLKALPFLMFQEPVNYFTLYCLMSLVLEILLLT